MNACATVTAKSDALCFQIGSHLYVWDRGALFRSEAITAVVAYLDLVVLQSLTGASLGGAFILGAQIVAMLPSPIRADLATRLANAGWISSTGRHPLILLPVRAVEVHIEDVRRSE